MNNSKKKLNNFIWTVYYCPECEMRSVCSFTDIEKWCIGTSMIRNDGDGKEKLFPYAMFMEFGEKPNHIHSKSQMQRYYINKFCPKCEIRFNQDDILHNRIIKKTKWYYHEECY